MCYLEKSFCDHLDVKYLKVAMQQLPIYSSSWGTYGPFWSYHSSCGCPSQELAAHTEKEQKLLSQTEIFKGKH